MRETYGPNKSRSPIGQTVSRNGERKWIGDEPIRISNSEIQTWKDDRRLWYLNNYRGLVMRRETQEVTGPRSLGTRIHSALEHYYTSDEPTIEYLKALYEKTAQQLLDIGRGSEIENLWKEYDLAHAMMTGYIEWVQDEAIDSGITLVEAEGVVEVESHLPGVHLRGKLDQRVVRKSDNVRLFRDFKTVGNLTQPTKILHLNEQMKFYHLLEHLDALQKTGKEQPWRTDGALYTMLRKVKRTANAKPPFYGQLEVRHNKREIETMWIRTTKVIEEIIDARVALDEGADHHYICPPRPNADLSWKSDFFPIYGLFDDGSNVEGMIEAYYEVGDPDARYKTNETEEVEA